MALALTVPAVVPNEAANEANQKGHAAHAGDAGCEKALVYLSPLFSIRLALLLIALKSLTPLVHAAIGLPAALGPLGALPRSLLGEVASH